MNNKFFLDISSARACTASVCLFLFLLYYLLLLHEEAAAAEEKKKKMRCFSCPKFSMREQTAHKHIRSHNSLVCSTRGFGLTTSRDRMSAMLLIPTKIVKGGSQKLLL